MKIKSFLIFPIAGILGFIIASCSGNKSVQETSSVQSNNIRDYLVKSARKITSSSLTAIQSLDDWERMKPVCYSELIEMLSMQDMPVEGKRSELNVRITGKIQREGYHIEKLYYESLPGLYVPANLYVPDNIKEPVPAVLYVCGHSLTQKVHYQPHPAKFAQLGFVCLIVETIQYGEVRGQHHGGSDINQDNRRTLRLYGAPEKIAYVETPGGHSYHQISREKIFSFFMEHLMGKKITPEEAGDIDQSQESLLSEEELKVYIDGPPADDRTTTIQDSFVKLAGTPDIPDESGLLAHRDSVKDFLMKRTFGAFPVTPPQFDPDSIGIAARDEMGVVALYSALLDGKCKTLILKNPPASQDVASNPDGRGPAIEMLNCLRITDVCHLFIEDAFRFQKKYDQIYCLQRICRHYFFLYVRQEKSSADVGTGF